MDRNCGHAAKSRQTLVALRKESVDRNTENAVLFLMTAVALRKESVDRNNFDRLHYNVCFMSLSARRAWIEIQCVWMPLALPVVALRKESVDRNFLIFIQNDNISGRSPQGERG